jgi:hypothetical protein
MLQYGITYLGVGVAEMTPAVFDEIVFDLFPRKVSCEPKMASEIVRELDAFWRFAKRELGARGADGCLDLLGRPTTASDVERALGDPGNWGMAKSFLMAGRAAGYDMTTEKGMREWQGVYNARMERAAEEREVGHAQAAFWGRSATPGEPARSHDAQRKEKRKRKAQRMSRRRSRGRR